MFAAVVAVKRPTDWTSRDGAELPASIAEDMLARRRLVGTGLDKIYTVYL